MRPLSITIEAEEASAATAPTAEQLSHLARKWFKEIQEFREWENARLFGENPPSPLDIRRHRYQLSALVTDGEMLLLGIALNNDPDVLGDGVTRKTIEAHQRCLQLTFIDWHGEMPKDRRESLLREVFPDA